MFIRAFGRYMVLDTVFVTFKISLEGRIGIMARYCGFVDCRLRLRRLTVHALTAISRVQEDHLQRVIDPGCCQRLAR